MICYKIFDVHIGLNGETSPKTLFHGNKGSRVLQLSTDLHAEKKMVRKGKKVYESGWHCYPSLLEVRKWTKLATNIDNRVVCKVYVSKHRMKNSCPVPTILADVMYISGTWWNDRKPLNEFVPKT